MKDLFDPNRKKIEEASSHGSLGEMLFLSMQNGVNTGEVRSLLIESLGVKILKADTNNVIKNIQEAYDYIETVLGSTSNPDPKK